MSARLPFCLSGFVLVACGTSPAAEHSIPATPTTPTTPTATANAQPPAAPEDAAPADLRKAMRDFEDSLRAQDTESFLALFSRTQPWRAIDTLAPGGRGERVSYDKLAADLQAKRGKYELLFDAAGDDCLRDYVLDYYAKPWAWVSANKFAPHDTDGTSVWVQWRREDDRWVVEAIAQPSA